jgi:RND family efflux transporter MFP subunit
MKKSTLFDSPLTRPGQSACRMIVAPFCVLLLAACQKKEEVRTPPPPDVQVVEVSTEDVPVVKEWVATLDGYVNAQIRAQVSGYLQKQTYQDGNFVQEGQSLFQIDPRPFQASVDQAKGSLAQAQGDVQRAQGELAQNEARQGKTQLDVTRYTPLAKTSAISQQELDDAVQANLGAKAGVEAAKAQVAAAQSAVQAAKATLEEAQLKLGFTQVISPISGIAGIAKGQVGDLVGPDSGNLTTVSTLNPIKAYFTISEQEGMAFQTEGDSPEVARARRAKLQLILSDGSTYPQKGKFFAADRQVEVGTGAIRLAAIFPNPNNFLRPGQFGRIRAVVKIDKGVALVPQRAIYELQGRFLVAIVGADNKVNLRPVKVGERVGSSWIVQDGLKPGERIVAEGLERMRDGITVNPTAYTPPAERKS